MYPLLIFMIGLFCLIILIFVIGFLCVPRSALTIDFVYTWVDHDPNVQKEIKDSPELRFLAANFMDNNELLFSLRSIETYAPWFNHVYIVVKDGQKPSWLNTDHPKVTLVPHSRLIPQEYLPTYNSLCIESFLHKIPNLSEHYVYFNDDMILLNHTRVHDFFDESGKPIESLCAKQDSYPLQCETPKPIELLIAQMPQSYSFHSMMQFNCWLLSCRLGHKSPFHQSQHIPSANRKSFQYSLDQFLQSQCFKDASDQKTNLDQSTKKSKKRENTNIARNSIFKKYWNMKKYGCVTKTFDLLYLEINHLRSIRQEILKIESCPNQFLCVQNSIAYVDKGKNIGVTDYQLLNQILRKRFPTPSSFEK